MSHEEEIARLRAENAALQNEARQIWGQIPDEYKLSSGARSPEAIRLMVKGLWAMSEELRALRAENASLDRIATDYYERLTGEAQEEIARLQSGIAALRADLINRRNVLVRRFRSVAAHQGAYMLPEIAVIEDVLRALGALVPGESEPT